MEEKGEGEKKKKRKRKRRRREAKQKGMETNLEYGFYDFWYGYYMESKDHMNFVWTCMDHMDFL